MKAPAEPVHKQHGVDQPDAPDLSGGLAGPAGPGERFTP